MRSRLWCLLLVAALPALASGSAAAGDSANAGQPSLLEFELKSLELAESHSLQRYQGRPVLLLFFEPDCSWCLRQVQAINELKQRCGAAFEAIAIGVNADRGRLRRELHRIRPQFPAYQASPQLVAAVGGIPATPFMLLGDRHGRLLQWLRGYVPPGRMAGELVTAGAGACRGSPAQAGALPTADPSTGVSTARAAMRGASES